MLGGFDPEAIAAMTEALKLAMKEFEDSDLVREVLALRIIGAAKTGERDPTQLRKAALAGLLTEEDDS
jgi:hypothetical protein